MFTRRKARQIKVGDVKIGGGAPISVQSMAKTDTRNVARTVRQIRTLEAAGCEIIRVAVLDREAARSIKAIRSKIRIPLVADIHFDYRLAVEAINAGADKIRLNPGNIKRKEDIAQVVKLAKKKRIPIRIGVNSGSVPLNTQYSILNTNKMMKAALSYIKLFESLNFHDIIVSLKASDVAATIDAYREMAGRCDYPFHLGVTAAGPAECGIIKSSVGIGALLSEGIGDTIRVSLTGDPCDEVRVGREILSSLGLRSKGIDIISCPTCGRCKVDLVKVVRKFENSILNTQYSIPIKHPIRVAIMGCVVNGPGEAKEADIGIAAGKGCGMLFRKGKIVKKIKEKDFVKTLLDEINTIFNANLR
jgi:(E)-4-hydroxy-3-methylbut-2-enyl-diphosphate synthase